MPIARILLILFALASPALAQDGARSAAAAQEAMRAFKLYVEGVTKKGGRPDLTRPEVAALLGRVYDRDALNALPPAQANDASWLLDWVDAANAATSSSSSTVRSRDRSPTWWRSSATWWSMRTSTLRPWTF